MLLMALLLTCGVFSVSGFGVSVRADDGSTEDEGVKVETEDEVIDDGPAEPGTQDEAEVTPPEPLAEVGPAPDVETSFLFTKYPEEDLPAGKIVQCLIAFHNIGVERSYTVQSVQASLRYPMDYSYHLQNYTRLHINKTVEANREATFSYVIRTSEHYTGRPFGFVIEVNYVDEDQTRFMHTVFNKTINFVEVDDSFDAEAILLYLFFATVAVLVAVIVYYAFFTSGAKKGSGPKKARVETGTSDMNGNAGGDEWLPAHARNINANKSPKTSSKPTTPKSGKKSKKDN
jgi:translocon-associated protein subunit alpha